MVPLLSKAGMPKLLLPKFMFMPFIPFMPFMPISMPIMGLNVLKSMSSSAGVPGCEDSGDVRLWFCMGTVPRVGVFTEETVGLLLKLNCCDADGVEGVDVLRPWWFCMVLARLTLSCGSWLCCWPNWGC